MVSDLNVEQIEQWLSKVKDPEIPVLSIADLGVLQSIEIADDTVHIGIIPTYSGCPAMHAIKDSIRETLNEHGIRSVNISLLKTPVWTTDLMSKKAMASLRLYGIAPPNVDRTAPIQCPQCSSKNTEQISQFGSTACKALYRCNDCLEPFDYFKCHA